MKAMKKIKEMLRRIGTAGLAAIMLTAQLPVTAFAEEIAQPQEIVVSDDVLPAEVQMEDVLPGESEGRIKEERPAFSESKSIDGVRITVEAEEGVFPEGAVLSVEKVTKDQEKKAEEAVETERSENQNVAVSYTYDIKVLDKDGNELQPADENGEDSSSRVKVSFKLDEVADENLTANVYHITENGNETAESNDVSTKSDSDKEETEGAGSKSAEAASLNDTDSTVDGESASRESTDGRETTGGIELVAEKLPVETDGDTAIVETDGFSLYTVEFTYNNKQYVLLGDSEVALSEILDSVGLTGEVSAVEVSDESLFSAKKCRTAEGGNTPEKDEDGNAVEDENGTWFVFAHQAFSSKEWMKVKINGEVYEITVTDDQANSVSYLEYNTSTYTFDTKTCASATAVTSSTSSVTLGTTGQTTWYVVDGEVAISSCTIVGNVNLILKNSSTLTVNYISLINNGNSLTIYAQSSDDTTMGQLVATGTGASVAAIGGNSLEDKKEYGSLTIHGGKITATGSNDVAGIGSNTGSSNRPCGNITI